MDNTNSKAKRSTLRKIVYWALRLGIIGGLLFAFWIVCGGYYLSIGRTQGYMQGQQAGISSSRTQMQFLCESNKPFTIIGPDTYVCWNVNRKNAPWKPGGEDAPTEIPTKKPAEKKANDYSKDYYRTQRKDST